jgi:hypothetical protein
LSSNYVWEGGGEQALLREGVEEEGVEAGLRTTRVIEKVDQHTQYVIGHWPAMGWARIFLAPRDLVLKRTWRYVPGPP